jgi:RNA polymerase sigma factor (sigma-70 family)
MAVLNHAFRRQTEIPSVCVPGFLLPFGNGDDYWAEMSEYELLQIFRKQRSEEAFAELLRRYAGLVYSVAKRRLANGSLAEDVMQIVFIRFAKAPPKVASSAHLAAWLHRTTLNVTVDMWRSETRRRNREQQSIVMEPATPENAVWEELAPNLDEALNQLTDEDRHALLLRFFAGKSMRDVGAAVGISEDAAKMRVSRAVDKLRTQLGTVGAACTAAMLGTILSERSVEAAPTHLISRLASMKLPAAAGASGLGAFLRVSNFKLAAGAAVVALITLGIVYLTRSPSTPASTLGEANPQSTLAVNTPKIPNQKRFDIARFDAAGAAAPKSVKMLFHVLDAETGKGLAHTEIHVAYFGVGGQGEGHYVVTDNRGVGAIPAPDDPAKRLGNVFVVAAGHVPKAVHFDDTMPVDYTMKLDPAMTAGGWVVDEQGVPVSDVKIMIQNPGIVMIENGGLKARDAENVDFQFCPVTNHDDGSWSCSYLPRDYTNEIRFILKKRGYAAALPVVPLNKVDLTNLVLVIERGMTVAGHITDLQNRPIAKASIKIVDGDPSQRQSAKTDKNGAFQLAGVRGDFESLTSPPVETNAAGQSVIRGLVGEGAPHLELAVQANGFAPQTNTIKLDDETNLADCTLSPGKLFRGRVMDEAGNPISNAIAQTDWDDQGLRTFDWTTRTDSTGHFEWDSAPEGPVLFWFEAEGYQVQRDVSLQADGSDHEITLKRNQ